MPEMIESTAIVEFTRIYLALFYTGVAAFYTIRIVTRKRVDSREVVFPGPAFGSTWWNHMLFRAFRMTIWMVCLFRWPFPWVDDYLGIFAALNVWPVLLAGNILLTAGFLFVVVVHFALGRQWRSGIDPRGPETLRVDGFFRFSRNPMFVGVGAAQAGFFLALPSVFSALCLLIGWLALHRQALAEEHHLAAKFPEDYRRYRHSVRRWL